MVHALVKNPRRVVRRLLSDAPFVSLAKPWQGQVTCLCYHSVSQTKRQAFWANHGLTVSTSAFERQMQHLRLTYDPRSLNDALLALKGNAKRHIVTVTFDDGYRNFVSDALPVLERFEIPCTIFVSPGILDRTARMWWEELEFHITKLNQIRMPWSSSEVRSVATSCEKYRAWNELHAYLAHLSPENVHATLDFLAEQSSATFSYEELMLGWNEIRELSSHPLITIGSHTVSHPTLSSVSTDDLAHELDESKLRLTKVLQKEISFLAYPIGGRDEAGVREFNQAKQSGYKAALSTRVGHWHSDHHEDAWALPRIPIVFEDSDDLFRWKISGFQACLKNRGRRKITI